MTGPEVVTSEDVSPEKQLCLNAALDLLKTAQSLAHSGDVDLDFADALATTANEIRKGYSTVNFRHTGIPYDTQPGRITK